jgi:hypothetical protein
MYALETLKSSASNWDFMTSGARLRNYQLMASSAELRTPCYLMVSSRLDRLMLAFLNLLTPVPSCPP